MLLRKLVVVLPVLTFLLAVADVVVAQYWQAALWALLTVYLVWRARTDGRRTLASARARAAWTPDRVREATDGIDGHVPAVKALRQADPGLSLVDADRLVKAARPA